MEAVSKICRFILLINKCVPKRVPSQFFLVLPFQSLSFDILIGSFYNLFNYISAVRWDVLCIYRTVLVLGWQLASFHSQVMLFYSYIDKSMALHRTIWLWRYIELYGFDSLLGVCFGRDCLVCFEFFTLFYLVEIDTLYIYQDKWFGLRIPPVLCVCVCAYIAMLKVTAIS